MNLERDGDEVVGIIKRKKWFPYHKGILRDTATSGALIDNNTYLIKFNGDIAEYVGCLEEGTGPHDIPNAFGKGEDFGIGGKFSGKFHPGSKKHKGFISNKTINTILNYFVEKYEGEIR